jgi:hypothetical protein
MTKLLALALLVGCDGMDHRPLTALGDVSVDVDVDLGAPWGTSTDDIHPGVTLSLEYTAPGCLSLENDAEGTLDGRPSDYSEVGWFSEDDVHGHTESYCTPPAFYFDRIQPPRDVSTIAVSDDSARFTIDVPRLLVNPTITLGELQRGTTAVATIDDPRPIATVRAWFQSDYNEPSPSYWPVDATIVGNEVHFPVPTTVRGTGTLGLNLTFEDHDLTCTGFAACTVSVHGGASFTRTIQ